MTRRWLVLLLILCASCAFGDDDTLYTDDSDESRGSTIITDGTTIIAEEDTDPGPLVYHSAHVYFDVMTTIGAGSTVTAATFYYYSISYAVTGEKPPTGHEGHIKIYDDDTSQYIEIFAFNDYAADVGDGANSEALIEAEYNAIGDGSNYGGESYDTEFVFECDDPGTDRSRIWHIEAYEHASTNHAYLYVEYTPAAGGTTRTAIIGVW